MIGPLPPPSGGMANQTRQLTGLLHKEGIEVEVVQVNAPYRPEWIGSLRGVRALFRLLPYLRRLWLVAGRAHLFHVMANSGWAWHLCAAPAVWIAKLRGVPVVINYRGGHAQTFFERSFFLIAPTMRLADSLVVPSRFLEQVFARFGMSAEVVPNIIDLSRFSSRQGNRPSRGLERHVIVTRNLEAIYDIETALRSLAIVKKTWPGVRMTIAGSGPEHARLNELTRTLGLTREVTFTGRLDNEQIPEMYRDADVFLNSSLVDNMPISILEALASGVPVVSTGIGGIPFFVENGKTALLVPPADAEAMAAAILKLFQDTAKAEALARAGRETVQQYTWQNVRARLFDVYSRLVRGMPEKPVAEIK